MGFAFSKESICNVTAQKTATNAVTLFWCEIVPEWNIPRVIFSSQKNVCSEYTSFWCTQFAIKRQQLGSCFVLTQISCQNGRFWEQSVSLKRKYVPQILYFDVQYYSYIVLMCYNFQGSAERNMEVSHIQINIFISSTSPIKWLSVSSKKVWYFRFSNKNYTVLIKCACSEWPNCRLSLVKKTMRSKMGRMTVLLFRW